MKRKQHLIQGILAATGLMILILDSRLALEGASAGVELCIKTIIPSLFPFFVLSMILTNTLSDWNSYPILAAAKFLGIPGSAVSVMIPSILGGYPVGAKCVGDLYQKQQISSAEAERMLSFCSNAGPSFLFGMVSGFFPERKWVWLLWAIHLFSAVLTAFVIPGEKEQEHSPLQKSKQQETAVILPAAKAMGLVCCWVILFRILISFLDVWFFWLCPQWLRVFLMGILELANGCCGLHLVTDLRLRFILCSCMLAFGGICVLFQTASVTQGLSLGHYLRGKFLQTFFSFLLSLAVAAEKGLLAVSVIPVLMILLKKTKNNYRNPRTSSV